MDADDTIEMKERKLINDYIEGRISKDEIMGADIQDLETKLEAGLKKWAKQKRSKSSLADAVLSSLTFVPCYWISVPAALLTIKIIDAERKQLVNSSYVAAKALETYQELFLEAYSDDVLKMLIYKWRNGSFKASSQTFINLHKLVSAIVDKLDRTKGDIIHIPETYWRTLSKAAIAEQKCQKFRIPSANINRVYVDECLEHFLDSLIALKENFPLEIAKELRKKCQTKSLGN